MIERNKQIVAEIKEIFKQSMAFRSYLIEQKKEKNHESATTL